MKIQTYNNVKLDEMGIPLEKANIVTKKYAHCNQSLHLSTHLLMINQSNEILCRLRGEDESRYPGLLTTTIGTHVELNENYLSTLQKYIPFELQLMWHGEFRVDDGFENEVCGLYMATIDSNKLPLEFKSEENS